jgi:sugar/nucleoside kinase (ribokinase family)
MNKNIEHVNIKKGYPICIGTGLVALDVVINGNPSVPLKLYAGGSCGNVITILSFLNWNTFPVARLKSNEASNKLLADLIEWKVNTSLITQTSDGSTPIIIERIKKDKNGNSIHTFQFRNPENGEWLPSYKPVLSSEVKFIILKSLIPNVFYFDRVNRSSIELAKYYKGNGAIIFFEPSSMKDNKQFEECLNIADIIKFSNDRIKGYTTKYPDQRVPLEIETLGKDGLMYRYSHQLDSQKWTFVPGYKISYVVDAAGSGDWFSAGLISKIATDGVKGFKNCNEKSLLKALQFGQSLGALNCFFDGARGLMYALNKVQIDSLVNNLQRSKTPLTLINEKENLKPITEFSIRSLY